MYLRDYYDETMIAKKPYLENLAFRKAENYDTTKLGESDTAEYRASHVCQGIRDSVHSGCLNRYRKGMHQVTAKLNGYTHCLQV